MEKETTKGKNLFLLNWSARVEKLSVPDMEQTIKTILQLENAC